MFCSFNLYKQLRNVSTKIQSEVKSKVDTIKKLNYENKTLFGPVQKEKKHNNNLGKEQIPESEVSSEIYWLLERKITKQSGDKKKNKQTESTELRKEGKANRAQSNPRLVKSKNHDSPKNVIPFNKKSLKSILKFPLISTENEKLVKSMPNPNITWPYPSVSKILQATMSEGARKALMNWKLTKISELGVDGFNRLQQDHLQRGKMLHAALQSYLVTGVQPEINSQIAELWDSVLPALGSLQPKVELTEVPVEHPFLKYKGVVDCVSRIGNDISVIEWKKSDKHKNTIESTYDAPVQLVAYLGALCADPRHNIVAKQGYVVVAYSDRKPAEIHHMDEIQLEKYWNIWLKKVQEFWIRTRDGTLPEPL